MVTTRKIIIITGPCGVGKTTIARILADKLDAVIVSGDELKEQRFPGIKDFTNHPVDLTEVEEAIFEQCKVNYHMGKTCVLDYLILGEEYIARFKDEFLNNLEIRVILPQKSVIYQRDLARGSWATDKKIIDHSYHRFLALIDTIGSDNYINNEWETAEETAQKIFIEI